MPTISTSLMSSIRVEDSQLLELSSLARKKASLQGHLLKVGSKGKKCTKKWCVVFRNLFFYYDCETYQKPSAVLFLESCICCPALVDLSDQSLVSEAENAFSVSYQGEYAGRQYVFLAATKDSRDNWISIINKSSMFKLQQDYQQLYQQHEALQNQLSSVSSELKHLQQQQIESQEDLAHLRASLKVPRRSSSTSTASARSPTPTDHKASDIEEKSARILQSHIRGWLIRRRWKHIVHAYMLSSHASIMRKRNRLIWKFVASEEEYVNQLNVLNGEFRNQFEIAACSNKPLFTLEQCVNIFRNCNELLIFHQLFLRGLHSRVEKWPMVILGDVLSLFLPMMGLYHQFIGNHTHAFDVLFDLKFRPKFKEFVNKIESRFAYSGHRLEELLVYPLKRIPGYIQDLNELKAHTPLEHVDYTLLNDMINELETVHKTVTDEVPLSENIRQVLKIESKIEGGCEALIDKEQTLVRKGSLCLLQQEDKFLTFSRKSRRRQNYCFLFSKHFLVTQKAEKKGEECYRFVKENGILPLAKCRIQEHAVPDCPAFGIIYEDDDGVTHNHVLIAVSVAEKAQWIADIAQCIENEKQNKILQSQSQGQPVELNSKFIRYSTFKSGKEQLVNCGNLDSLLQRLTKASYFGLDFLNTFLTTFPLFTTGHHVLDYLIKSYHRCIEMKLKVKLPEDCVKEARYGLSQASNRTTLPGANSRTTGPTRCYSTNSGRDSASVSGIFFALKHWICKHYYHFKESQSLDIKLQELLDIACQEPKLTSSEKRLTMEVSQLYMMQKNDNSTEQCLILQYFTSPKKSLDSFDVVLSWQPRKLAEQLCLIDSVMFCQIKNNELLRYLTYKGQNKSDAAPNVVNSIQHFNRMSIFWMWTVAKQPNEANRARAVEFLILLGIECYQLNNFMSTMAILGALEHSTVLRLSSVLDGLPKSVKQHLRTLRKLGSTDSCYRELKTAIRKATPPLLPYLALTMNELTYISESTSNYIEGDLINFAKMRKYTKTCHSVIQQQKDTYDFPLDTEILQVLLCNDIPGDENVLYEYVDSIYELN